MKLKILPLSPELKGTPEADKLIKLIERHAKELATIPGAVAGEVILKRQNPGKPNEVYTVELTIRSKTDAVLASVVRKLFPAYKIQKNDMFELDESLQGKGLGKIVDKFSLGLADTMGMKKISLDANLTAGGYVWLRRGFWPNDGREFLDNAIEQSNLSPDLKEAWGRVKDADVRKFVLSAEFSQYKSAFMGSDWAGAGMLDDSDFRKAYLGELPKPPAVVDPRLTAQERYRNAVLRYEVDIRRYTAGEQQALSEFLAAQDRLLAARIAEIDPESAGSYTAERLEQMRQELSAMAQATLGEAQVRVAAELAEFAQVAGAAEVSMLGRALPFAYDFATPSPQKLAAIIRTIPFQGRLMSTWFNHLLRATQKRLWATVRAGIAQGETTQAIVQRLIGTKANNYTDGVLSETRRNATAIARTAVNHVSNTAREEVWKENREVIDGRIWLSTLDGRTTLLCGSRDHNFAPLSPGGRIPPGMIPLEPPDARPPAHWNCRSTVIAYMNGVALLGDRPSVVDTRTRAGREVDFRKIAKEEGKTIQQVRKEWSDKAVGQVPGRTNYDSWLRGQSWEFQNEVLGPQRAELYRNGKLTLDQFTDASGEKYTLAELRAKYPQSFALDANPRPIPTAKLTPVLHTTPKPPVVPPEPAPSPAPKPPVVVPVVVPQPKLSERLTVNRRGAEEWIEQRAVSSRDIPEIEAYISGKVSAGTELQSGSPQVYRELNYRLRNSVPLDDELTKINAALHAAATPLGDNAVNLYRGVDKMTPLEVGSDVDMTSWASTTLLPRDTKSFGGRDNFFEIRTSADTRAVITDNRGEAEILLPPGAKFRVVEVRKDYEIPTMWDDQGQIATAMRVDTYYLLEPTPPVVLP